MASTSDIHDFLVPRAEAEIDPLDNSLVVRLYYPKDPKSLKGRLPEELEFGKQTLDELMKTGFAKIATPEFPIRPASAGGLYVTSDNVIIPNRRSHDAPTHRLYFEACAGYTNKPEHANSAEGVMRTMDSELTEECLVFLRPEGKGQKPRLVLERGLEELTLKSAKRLGIEVGKVRVDGETIETNDSLEVYDSEGDPIFNIDGILLDIMYESSRSINALQLRRLPFHSSEIFPVDAEFGGPDWFNRESYMIPVSDLANLPFGTPLPNPKVFRTRIENGVPSVYTPDVSEYSYSGLPQLQQGKFYGPDLVKVSAPHTWAPDNLLVACLRGLNVPGYSEQGVKTQLGIEKWKVSTKQSRLADGTWNTLGLLFFAKYKY